MWFLLPPPTRDFSSCVHSWWDARLCLQAGDQGHLEPVRIRKPRARFAGLLMQSECQGAPPHPTHTHLDPAKMPRENRSCWGCATVHSHCPCLLHSQQLRDSPCSAPALCLSPSILCTSEASSQCRESRLLLRGLWLGKKKPASVGGTACSWTEAGKLRTTGRTQASSSSFV